MKFQMEKLCDSLEEAKPLLQQHWAEIAHYKDIPLNPDYDSYAKLEQLGRLRIYTARDDQQKLIGYAVYILDHALHYKQILVAKQDIVFVVPNRRGVGVFLLRYCDEDLKKIGVHMVSHHVKAAHNWGKALEIMGYELQDLMYTKRLDR